MQILYPKQSLLLRLFYISTTALLALFIILIFFALFAIYLMQNIIINLSTVNNKKNNRLHFQRSVVSLNRKLI